MPRSRSSFLTIGKCPRFPLKRDSVLITRSDFRVFLTGKEHVAYRKALNALFTRKALGSVPFVRSCDVAEAETHFTAFTSTFKTRSPENISAIGSAPTEKPIPS